jgi:hypothetical protein
MVNCSDESSEAIIFLGWGSLLSEEVTTSKDSGSHKSI